MNKIAKFHDFFRTTRLSLPVLLALGGCATDISDSENASGSESSNKGTSAALSRDLDIGDQGAEVETLHQYLMSYGYFPSAELAKRYPNWRPIVTTGPASMQVYDERTAEAVSALQTQMSLTQTGFVDEATRAALRMSRCAVPDGIQPLDPSDKFNTFGNWGKYNLTWRNVGAPGGINVNLVLLEIQNALNAWGDSPTHMTFTQTSSATADITVLWEAVVDGGNAYGMETGGPPGKATVHMYSGANYWSDDIPVPADRKGLRSGLAHELGHALGLDHSPQSSNVMSPGLGFGTDRKILTKDDDLGIRALYDQFGFVTSSGGADVGVGSTGTNEVVWLLSYPAVGNDFNIYKWNGSNTSPTFSRDSANGAAVRIAVESGGVPWVVNSVGDVYQRSSADSATGVWTLRSGQCAKDIAVYNASNVWIIGCDGHMYKRSGNQWVMDPKGSSGSRISVGNDGRPWMVNTAGKIYRRNNSDVTSTSGYTQIKDDADTSRGTDVAVSYDNTGYVIGVSPKNQVYVWDEQAAGNGVAGVKNFIPIAGSPSSANLAVGPHGDIWLLKSTEGRKTLR